MVEEVARDEAKAGAVVDGDMQHLPAGPVLGDKSKAGTR
jgi:hypothetical protein